MNIVSYLFILLFQPLISMVYMYYTILTLKQIGWGGIRVDRDSTKSQSSGSTKSQSSDSIKSEAESAKSETESVKSETRIIIPEITITIV